MDGVKTLSLLMIVIALFGIWLASKGYLEKSIAALILPNPNTPTRTDGPSFGAIILSLVVLSFALSFFNPKTGLTVAVIVAMGALLLNHQRMGDNDVINQLSSMFGARGDVGYLPPSQNTATGGGPLIGPIGQG